MERYFYARPQFGNIGVPDYTSERGTLPVYMSRELAVGLESMARVLSQSREDAEAEAEAEIGQEVQMDDGIVVP